MLWPVSHSQGTINQGAFAAIGIFGQAIYINPKENVVIVVWGAQPKPTGKATIADDDFFAAVCEALRGEGMAH
jgi:CubicO group peptidase (beta-lactamase class C family)